ncbi:DUF1765-domain-containing protein [Bimuria novae-zelandiae CBS 107.79]|uniref:DUF1765-domain-containing protein n=1 Tax=Bimuria novae-zelandiae CBS 107.79 TaxID=1447943 RepID=A0A6A5VUK9_9PLEO|nr:DUF1765-domain-containing protein [Bimuria novae-zelandiae CBS 107.79]
MHAIAPVQRGHNLLSNALRGRSRAVSEVLPPPAERQPEKPQLPKAASYTYFPRVKDLDDPQLLELKGTISEDELNTGISPDESYSSSEGSSPDEEGPRGERTPEMPQLRPSNSRRSSRFLPFSSKSREPSKERKPERTRSNSIKRSESSNAVSPVRSLTKLRRKSFVAPRSSSPTKDTGNTGKESEPRKNSLSVEANKRKGLTVNASIPEESRSDKDAGETPRKSRVLTKKTNRLSGFFSASSTDPVQPHAPENEPPVPPLPKSFSTDKLPSYVRSPTSPTHIPPLPHIISPEKFKGPKTEPRKKDELWTAFRTLEGDLRKFQHKSIAFKANVVRTALLPFLRAYATHPSNTRLRPEDLDRRANILNGWWTGLLELLSGRNNQSVSGTDRPAILEGIAGLMERPEWRLPPSPFCALADRVETASTTTAKSAGSASSSTSDFLTESVHHNVRNIFTQNLLSQMSFVIEKMALRNAAASLVTFCGKTCAYAFCFCTGVAEIMVRLWTPAYDTMRRVLEESGVTKLDRLDDVSEHIIFAFPPTLHSLKFKSLTTLARSLRRSAVMPLGTASLDWYGAWVKRWSGAESDLFYVFVKHYHILISEFLPPAPTSVQRICAPGMIMVHSQILVNMDATINRHAAPQQPEETTSSTSSITFDDVLADPDASASAVPIPPVNATRQMAENRLIMLLRDFLSERNSHIASARQFFAESFSCLLKAAARKVSVYDSNACYTLCDFLEEAFIILARYEHILEKPHSVLDWPFWMSVCKLMTSSHNTATEIKLFAFLYSTWSVIVSDEHRKESLCLDFLLEPEFFESRFNHWCPMVRAYFMRILCWRVARFDGGDSTSEINIMKALSDRLRSVWSHYLWLREQAEHKRALPPSTQACNPAPGRRFLIIRNDNPIVTNTQPFLSFDGVVQSPTSGRFSDPLKAPPERPLSSASVDSQDFPDESATKGRWNILRSFMGAAPKQAAKSKGSDVPKKDKVNAKPNGAAASNETGEPTSNTKSVTSTTPAHPPPTHRSYSFRFSLEWVDKRFGTYQNMRLSPPRLPLPAQVLLQEKGININVVLASQPTGPAATSSRYAGRALAEWTFVSHECQNFFDRRKNEGVPANKQVETPTLAVEAFRRPG